MQETADVAARATALVELAVVAGNALAGEAAADDGTGALVPVATAALAFDGVLATVCTVGVPAVVETADSAAPAPVPQAASSPTAGSAIPNRKIARWLRTAPA